MKVCQRIKTNATFPIAPFTGFESSETVCELSRNPLFAREPTPLFDYYYVLFLAVLC
jgi:hypothetical protein